MEWYWSSGLTVRVLCPPNSTSEIAENDVMICEQPNNAWTFELDLSPAIEKW